MYLLNTIEELARACRVHFLLYDCLPPNYMMHPVVMFMYIVNTSMACALGLVTCESCKHHLDQMDLIYRMRTYGTTLLLLMANSGPTVFDSEFFLPQVQKFAEFLKVCRQRSIASSLAGKAVMLLEKLMAQAERSIDTHRPASKQKCGTGSAVGQFKTSDTDQLKHKVAQVFSTF